MADSSSKQIDRQTTVPFHLKLFYSQNTFHPLSDFPTPNPGSDYVPPLPPHIQIYTWQSCTLRELATLLTSAIPSLLPEPAVGTRVSFRLIYPDTKGAIMAGPDSKGRYLSKDLGSVIIGASSDGEEEDAEQGHEGSREREEEEEEKPRARKNGRIVGEDADRTLQDMRFVIGDYVDCAIQAPLADGSVAPPLPMPRAEPRPFVGGGMRAFGGPSEGMGGMGGGRNGYGGNGYGGGRYGGGYGGGGYGRRGGRGSAANAIPTGEWRRGERLPDAGGWGYDGGRRRGRY